MKKRQKGFRRNILEKFMITAVIPVLLLLVLFTAFMWGSSQFMLHKKTAEAGQVIAEKLRQMDRDYRESCAALAESPALLEYLKTGEGSSRVFEQYYQSVSSQELKFQAVVVDLQKQILLRSSAKDGYRIDYSFLPLSKLAESGGRQVTRIFSRVAAEGLMYYYGYGAVVYDGARPAGYVIYYSSSRDMGNLLEESGAEEVVITNQFDTVVVTTSESARTNLNKLAYQPDERGNVAIGGNQYYMDVCSLDAEGLKVYTLGSRIYERYLFRIIPPFIILVVVFLMFLLYQLSQDMSRRVTEPIDQLMDAVRQISKGQFDVSVKLDTGDEFELLAGEYNRMVRKVDGLIESNRQMAELQRKTEFKMIRDQFNPHFIFNVLETLRYMIFVSPKEAERVILALSQFLRYNIYNQDKFVPLKEDMEHMEDFLLLHKARFQERMTYEILMDEDAGKALVPKFFVQPFAENAIKYGFKSKDHFHIDIRAELVDDGVSDGGVSDVGVSDGRMSGSRLAVSVKDDGGGMTAQRYEEVCRRLEAEDYPDDHIGLYNINRMLKMIYGKEYGLKLVNREGEGLEVRVVIPVREA